MKIALVVFPIHASHGCILQTYALYTKLKEMGHIVTIVNRLSTPINTMSSLRRAFSNIKRRLNSSYSGPIFYRGHYPKAIMKNLQPFVDAHFGNDVVTIYSREEAVTLVSSQPFEAFVVGSDQVWRPKNVPDVCHYFLEFVPMNSPVKRVAYAPSFGTGEWEYNEEQYKICKKLISRFNAISAREDSGVELCKKYFGVDAKLVLDPTMLLSKDDYLNLLDDKEVRKEKKLSYYYLDESEEKMTFMNSIANNLGLKSHRINTKTENRNAKIQDRIAPSIEDWLGGFVKSEFVIVDSFHAMVFAILFNVPFIVVANVARGMARFTSLLDLLGLSDRLVKDVTKAPLPILTQQIDWERVNSILDKERKRCSGFLNTALRN